MLSHTEKLVFEELKELKNLEIQLQMKWNCLTRAGKDVRSSFISSLYELEMRAQQLDRTLDSHKQRTA
jgi:hypothetical protein